MKKVTKLVYTIIIFLAFISDLYSQNIFFDSKKIFELMDDGKTVLLESNKDQINDLLANYCRKDQVSTIFYQNNPFISDFVEHWGDKSGGNGGQNVVGVFKSIGGLDVTKYANAIADIMIERAKQELTVAFFDRFKKFAEDNAEFQILFPKTTSNLANLLSYQYPQMLPALRSGFFNDLEKLPYQLDDLLELPRYQGLLSKFPEIRVAVRSIGLIQNLEAGTSNAADIILLFSQFPEWSDITNNGVVFKNMAGGVKFAAILSESVRADQITGKIWISKKEASGLLKNEAFIKIFMGLLYQKIDGINFYNKADKEFKMQTLLVNNSGLILTIQKKIEEFLILGDKVIESYQEIKTKKKSEVTNENIYNYVSTSIDVIDYALSVVKILSPELINENYLIIPKKANELYKCVYNKSYTQAVQNSLDIIKVVHEMTTTNSGINSGDKGSLTLMLSFIEKAKPYALFMANMVEAKDENEIKAALENVILPVGSSSIKKNTNLNLSVQTYLGAYWSVKNSDAGQKAWANKFGVTAPIGISITPGFASWRRGGSLSFFTSLFDLGAIVDYKLKKEPDVNSNDPNATVINKEYKIELGNIFSPGAYLVYGAPLNLPLALGFGAQYGPGLFKVESSSSTLVNPSWRWNLFIAVDMPFFNLMNKNRNE